MPLLLLALAAVGVLALRKQGSGAVPGGAPKPSPVGGTTAGGGALAPKSGKEAQLSLGGRSVSLASIAQGIAVGVSIGGEVDKLLGGTGTGVRGYVAQALGGIIGAVFVILGTVAACYVAFFAVVAYGLVFSFDELGQRLWTEAGGPAREYRENWEKLYNQMVPALLLADPAASQTDVERFATHACDGYMLQSNRIKYLKAMSLAWGIGATRWMHADYQWRHGAFAGKLKGVAPNPVLSEFAPPKYTSQAGTDAGAELDDSEVERRGEGIAWVSGHVPLADQVPLPGKRYVKLDTATQLRLTAAMASDAAGITIGALPAFLSNPSNYELMYGDAKAATIRSAAAAASNAAAYVSWMAGAWGTGQTEASHAAWGLAHGEFEGVVHTGPFDFKAPRGTSLCHCVGSAGALEFAGRLWYWRNTEGQTGAFSEVK